MKILSLTKEKLIQCLQECVSNHINCKFSLSNVHTNLKLLKTNICTFRSPTCSRQNLYVYKTSKSTQRRYFKKFALSYQFAIKKEY